ncbi:pentatricopeptide repeat protein [Aspergillus sp. HF37]|nr:pentatricopeptide repeat protein [Aspergillus sp. HF37]
MLRQAVQGARWYQHVALRSSSISRPSLRAFSAIAPRSLDYGGPNDKVNFYEQTTRQSKDRRKVDPEEEEKAERDEVEGELSRLDRELAVIKEGPFSPNSPFMKSLPEKDRAIALEALRKHEEQEQGSQNEPDTGLDQVFDGELDDLIKEEFGNMGQEEENWQTDAETDESLPPVVKHPFEITLSDSTSHPYVERLNKCLRLFASDSSDDLLRQEIWRWYRRCKQSCSGFLESMPGEAVDLIWASQATGRVNMATRTAHMQTLVDDAESTGRMLSTPHTLSYIESLHDSGNATEALEQWEAHQEGLSQSMEDLEAYWKLGVRLFAAEDNPQRAQSIALAFLASDKSREPRVLIPVITAWGRQPGEQAEVSAWKLYLQLKTLLGSNMTMEDYDHISIGLLKAGRLDTALAVFKDMMVTYQDPAKDSTALYKAALGLAGNLQASSITEQDVNKVSLSALTFLPNRFQNRFFYASWLKKLIGMGEVDSAALVIELMYERGVKPDSKHLNGMIAAWLREGAPSSRDKAEQLGWAMIQQRVDMAWMRVNPSTNSPQVHEGKELDTARIPKWMQREVPAGTIETFSVLILHYTRRSDDDMIRYLTKCLGDAQLQPNSFFMNHLLYAELRRHNLGAVWHKYRAMTESVKPDLETYACLWDSGKVQYDLGRKASHGDFPPARDVYAEMMAWYADHHSPRGRAVTQEQFSKDLYDQIIRCFCFSKDLPGTIVALYSMGLEFSVFPDDVTARMVILQVARMAGVPPNTPSRRLRRLSSTPRSKENIAYVNRLLEILSSRKAATLESQGLSIDTLDPQEKQQYQLEILAMLLRVVMSRTAADPERIEDEIAAVAREMGVPGIYLGSPLGRDESLLQ